MGIENSRQSVRGLCGKDRQNVRYARGHRKARLVYEFVMSGLPLEKMMICLSGQHEMTTDFSGFRNFFTLNFFPKPIYDAYVMLARLGDTLLETEGCAENLSILPTKSADGGYRIMLCHTSHYFDTKLEPLDADLVLENTGIPDGEATVRLWKIDGETSNAYNTWKKLGSPEKPSNAQIETIRREGTLHYEDVQASVQGGTLILPLTMPSDATYLAELR